ncbi:probable E3 ubiquitin-protein ligase RHB1A [Malania oleifera]|uniref:probable E3 ubiquitin-protein ligase RHB1A n=1 Tax=Malania oleifera TaxID=397392 RepID=UPI0025AE4CD4|nr:probable E3 ubiquitin-protein ligase RHB1A [Malania oleifera]
MGGCCCCSSRRADQNRSPAYYYFPRVSEEHQPLSAHHGATSALSTGLLVDTNLDTSIPDTYRPPPVPMPYDADLGRPQTPPETCGNKNNTTVQTTNSDLAEENAGGNTCEELSESDGKVQTNFELDTVKQPELELSKSTEPIVSSMEEEDVCPTCLEEYDAENPKIITKCEHHFHLACILEWMERSDTCPVCDKEMIFNPPVTE